MKETYTKETGPGQPEPDRDVIVTDHRPDTTPSPDRTLLWVGVSLLATMMVVGLFWVINKDDDRARVATNVVTEPVAVREVNPDDNDSFVHTSTVEIRDLRSSADTLAQNASAENRNRIVAYKSRVDSLDRALRESDNSAQVRADLEGQLKAMRTEYTELQNDLQNQATATHVEAEQAVNTAENAQEQASKAGRQNELTAFSEQAETRVESLETQLVKLQAGPQTQETSTNLSRLGTEVENVSSQVDQMQSASDTEIRSRLRDNIDVSLLNLEQQMQTLKI